MQSSSPQYQAMYPLWSVSEDAYGGETVLKQPRIRVKYLPPTKAQKKPENKIRYNEYVEHAIYDNDYKPAILAAVGIMQSNEPSISWEGETMDGRKVVAPPMVRDMLHNGNLYDDGLSGLKTRINLNQLIYGRYGLLLEVFFDNDSSPAMFSIVEYDAKSILDGEIFCRTPTSKPELRWIVLQENGSKFDYNTKSREVQEMVRVVGLDQNYRYYSVKMTAAEWGMFNPVQPNHPNLVYPNINGTGFARIPFTIVNTDKLGLNNWTPPPLIDLAYLCIHAMRVSADLRHGQRYTAMPTLFGKAMPSSNLEIGAGAAILVQDDKATLEFLQPDSSGFDSLQQTLNDLQKSRDQFSVMTVFEGAGANASGKSLELRFGAGTADIALIDRTSAKAIEEQLVWAGEWAGMTREDASAAIGYEVTAKYLNAELSIATIVQLISANAQNPIVDNEDLHKLIQMIVGADIVKDWEDSDIPLSASAMSLTERDMPSQLIGLADLERGFA